jgi:hypothetical protein
MTSVPGGPAAGYLMQTWEPQPLAGLAWAALTAAGAWLTALALAARGAAAIIPLAATASRPS